MASSQKLYKLLHKFMFFKLLRQILKAAMVAQRRGSKSISQDDMMFVIRLDTSKLRRLREFINWKDVRKNAKSGQEETSVTNIASSVPFEVESIEEEDETLESASVNPSSSQINLPTSKPTVLTTKTSKSSHKKRPQYYWDYLASLVAEVTQGEILDIEPIDVDEELDDSRAEGLRRLREADEITRKMTKLEYMEYTECRQASFTYKKAKKFRDWLGIPLSVTEFRLSDDVLEILGFLAAEFVRQITEGALKYVDQEPKSPQQTAEDFTLSIFKAPMQRTPIRPCHIHKFLEGLLLEDPTRKTPKLLNTTH